MPARVWLERQRGDAAVALAADDLADRAGVHLEVHRGVILKPAEDLDRVEDVASARAPAGVLSHDGSFTVKGSEDAVRLETYPERCT